MDLKTLKESKYIVIRNYFDINTDWQSVLNLVYKNEENIGSTINKNLWIKFKDRKPFDHVPDLKDFCYKLNQDFNSVFIENCGWNEDWHGSRCNCPGIWHIDTPLMSLGSFSMSKHQDRMPAAYIQILGKSFWRVDSKDELVLNPSDLLLLHKGTDHEVWGKGPRFAILLAAVDEKIKLK